MGTQRSIWVLNSWKFTAGVSGDQNKAESRITELVRRLETAPINAKIWCLLQLQEVWNYLLTLYAWKITSNTCCTAPKWLKTSYSHLWWLLLQGSLGQFGAVEGTCSWSHSRFCPDPELFAGGRVRVRSFGVKKKLYFHLNLKMIQKSNSCERGAKSENLKIRVSGRWLCQMIWRQTYRALLRSSIKFKWQKMTFNKNRTICGSPVCLHLSRNLTQSGLYYAKLKCAYVDNRSTATSSQL